MGMYTALHFNAELKDDVPEYVIDTLKYMVGDVDKLPGRIEGAPTHPLFDTDRWRGMLRSDSAYFYARTRSELVTEYGAWFIHVQCNLKNYDDEIAKFLDFIMPHVRAYPGEFLGYWMYEEDDRPTLIFYPDEV